MRLRACSEYLLYLPAWITQLPISKLSTSEVAQQRVGRGCELYSTAAFSRAGLLVASHRGRDGES